MENNPKKKVDLLNDLYRKNHLAELVYLKTRRGLNNLKLAFFMEAQERHKQSFKEDLKALIKSLGGKPVLANIIDSWPLISKVNQNWFRSQDFSSVLSEKIKVSMLIEGEARACLDYLRVLREKLFKESIQQILLKQYDIISENIHYLDEMMASY